MVDGCPVHTSPHSITKRLHKVADSQHLVASCKTGAICGHKSALQLFRRIMRFQCGEGIFFVAIRNSGGFRRTGQGRYCPRGFPPPILGRYYCLQQRRGSYRDCPRTAGAAGYPGGTRTRGRKTSDCPFPYGGVRIEIVKVEMICHA